MLGYQQGPTKPPSAKKWWWVIPRLAMQSKTALMSWQSRHQSSKLVGWSVGNEWYTIITRRERWEDVGRREFSKLTKSSNVTWNANILVSRQFETLNPCSLLLSTTSSPWSELQMSTTTASPSYLLPYICTSESTLIFLPHFGHTEACAHWSCTMLGWLFVKLCSPGFYEGCSVCQFV